jgi:predicted O-methyltransferase YrrM
MSEPVNYDLLVKKAPALYDFTLYTPTLDTERYPQAKDLDPPDTNDFFRIQTNQMGHNYPATNMSSMNLFYLSKYFEKVKESAKLIVEIGVVPNMTVQNSSTYFISNKFPQCTYLGIDVCDRSYVEQFASNVHFLKTDSKNTELIVNEIKKYGGEIDFLFIDGLHTIEQVKYELALIPYVRKGGIIGFHDTMVHIGPNVWMKAFDPSKFTIHNHTQYNDWGLGILEKNF